MESQIDLPIRHGTLREAAKVASHDGSPGVEVSGDHKSIRVDQVSYFMPKYAFGKPASDDIASRIINTIPCQNRCRIMIRH